MPSGPGTTTDPRLIDPQGSGSGLDADLLDGKEASEFLQPSQLVAGDNVTITQEADGDLVIAAPAASGLHADLTDLATSGHAADIISYDNTTSGLTATEVQAAIDEVAASGGSSGNMDGGLFTSPAGDYVPTATDGGTFV